jgi:hypothetical protein
VVGNGPSDDNGASRSAEAKLRALHEHVYRGDDSVEDLIHPEAEMSLLVSYGRTLQGRSEIVRALERGREAAIYRAQVVGFEWLDANTSLTTGNARYPIEGSGFAEGRVYWLDELRDGLVWRVEFFRREAEARAAYERRFEQLIEEPT